MRRALVPLLSVTSACALITSFDGFDEPKAHRDDGGTDASVEAAPPPVCSHKRWPAPPDGGSGSEIGDVFGAVRAMSLVSSGPEPLGFDLDELCSCPERLACTGAQPGKPCDPRDSGIDNAATSLFAFFSAASGIALDESGLRSGLDRGRFGLVFRVSAWNGEPSDPELRVAVFNAFDVNPGTDGGAKFDGNDKWLIDDESLVDDRIPVYPSTTAYVADGVLVAMLPRLRVKIRIPTVNEQWLLIPVEMRDVHLTARIERTGGGITLRGGELGGRMPTASLLALAASAGVCPGTDGYRSLKPLLCDARDVPIDPGKDGRDAPCEALSMGLGFEAVPAAIVGDAGKPTDLAPCAEAGPADDCN